MRYYHMKISTLVLFSALIVLAGCSSPDSDIDRPDISGVTAEVEIRRFDRDLFALDTSNIQADRQELMERYGEFAELYFYQILGLNDPRIAPEGPDTFLTGLLTYPATRKLYDTIQIVYPDLEKERQTFETAFRYLKAIFPDRPTPRITTFLSEFSIANFIYGQDELAVGLDFYMGSGYPYVLIDTSNAVFLDYITRT